MWQGLTQSRSGLNTQLAATITPWDIDYVVERIGSVEVPVRQIVNGDYRSALRRTMSVRDYIEEVSKPSTIESLPYLSELSYDRYFPELARELVAAPRFKNEQLASRVMYLGKSVNSQLHRHLHGSAILFCIQGRKLVRLYAPDQTKFLYEAPHSNFSDILIASLDTDEQQYDAGRFPAFANAVCREITLVTGDALFIPIHWWHSVQNFAELSLSSVFFWRRDRGKSAERYDAGVSRR